MKHLMVDLETMSTRGDAAIVEIGAVIFDPQGGEMGAKYQAHVKLTEGSGHIEPGTVLWWMTQSQEARALLHGGQQSALPLAVVLAQFSEFCAAEHPAAVWSHGATFDLPILDAAYRRCGLRTPWDYRDARDTRTLFDLAGKEMTELVAREGVHHGALDDAVTQAKAVHVAWTRLKGCP